MKQPKLRLVALKATRKYAACTPHFSLPFYRALFFATVAFLIRIICVAARSLANTPGAASVARLAVER